MQKAGPALLRCAGQSGQGVRKAQDEEPAELPQAVTFFSSRRVVQPIYQLAEAEDNFTEFRSQAPGLMVRRGAEFVCAFGGPARSAPRSLPPREACGFTRNRMDLGGAWLGEGLLR